MKSNDWEKSNSPLAIILCAKDDAAERILFMYPLDFIDSNLNGIGRFSEDSRVTISNQSSSDPEHSNRFGIPIKMLAPLLCSGNRNGTSNGTERDNSWPFEIKVDNICFAGHPWKLSCCVHTLAIVFALNGFVDPEVVEDFQRLSKKIAIAIDNEQQRCNYFKEQIVLMQSAHDEFETLSEEQKRIKKCPYTTVLERSGLAKHIKDIYADITKFGVVDIFFDECIEVGFCIEPKAKCYAGLTPKPRRIVERIMKGVCSYHTILFIDETFPHPDSNPVIFRFYEVYEPTRSIDEMSLLSKIPVSQLLQIVRHLLLWARAVVIYPICSTNVYVISDNDVQFTKTDLFNNQFPNCSLPDILEQFSIPTTLFEAILGTFLLDAAVYSSISVNMDILLFLLRNDLIIQIHTYVYLLPQPQKSLNYVDQNNLSPRIRSIVNSQDEKISLEMKETILSISSHAISSGTPEVEVFGLISTFFSLLPYMNGRNHIEDIIHRTGLTRSTITRIFQDFSEILCLFCSRDVIFDESF